MSIYQFPDDSPVSKITFHYLDGKPIAALLEAGSTASPKELADIRIILADHTMSTVPVTVNGRAMLQVEGFKATSDLTDALAANSFTKGVPQITREQSDDAVSTRPKGISGFFKRYSLKMAGILNLIGDLAMHIGGYKEISNAKTTQEKRSGYYHLAGGGLYTLGGANLAVYGSSISDAPDLSKRTADFIEQKTHPHAAKPPIFNKPGHFLRRRAADITLANYSAGAALFLQKGISDFRANARSADFSQRKRGRSIALISYGSITLLGKLLSLFIAEKPDLDDDEHKHKPRGVFGRIIHWFREKPMRIFGVSCFIVDTIFGAYAYMDYLVEKNTPNVKSRGQYIFSAITSVSYLMADYFSAISSKNPLTEQLSSDKERVVIAGAMEKIANQPKEKQQALVSEVATFLSRQPEMRKGKKPIQEALLEQARQMGSNSWAARAEIPATSQLQASL